MNYSIKLPAAPVVLISSSIFELSLMMFFDFDAFRGLYRLSRYSRMRRAQVSCPRRAMIA